MDSKRLLDLAVEFRETFRRQDQILEQMQEIIRGDRPKRGRPRKDSMTTTKKQARTVKGRAPKKKKTNRARRPNRETLDLMNTETANTPAA